MCNRLGFWAGVTAVALATFAVLPCAAQQIITGPLGSTSANGDASGTIAVTNTFQKVFGAANNSAAPVTGTAGARRGCSIQNNSTHVMYITEGKGIAASSLTNSWQVQASGGLFNCNFAGIVLVGEIDITGTAGDAFVANQE